MRSVTIYRLSLIPTKNKHLFKELLPIQPNKWLQTPHLYKVWQCYSNKYAYTRNHLTVVWCPEIFLLVFYELLEQDECWFSYGSFYESCRCTLGLLVTITHFSWDFILLWEMSNYCFSDTYSLDLNGEPRVNSPNPNYNKHVTRNRSKWYWDVAEFGIFSSP